MQLRDTYKTLAYPNLPCAIRRIPGAGTGPDRTPRVFHYPLEVLRIVPGQRVPLQKQTPQLADQMIRECQTLVLLLYALAFCQC